MRKRELFGLKKADVGLPNRLLTVARSYDQPPTKGKHADIVPIAKPLLPVLARAIEASHSEYVSPSPDRTMRPEQGDPRNVLRHALGRAGIVEGYEHLCRRCKARGKANIERRQDAELRTCPVCEMKLWPKAILRPMRFHDLRHTTATFVLQAGVDFHRVQRIRRDRDVTLTADTYGQLQVEDLRSEVNTLALMASGPFMGILVGP